MFDVSRDPRVRETDAMTSEGPATESDLAETDFEEPDFEDFGLDGDFEPEPIGNELAGANEPLLRAPPIQWTFRSVLAIALVFAVVGFSIGYIVAKPRPPGENSVDVGFMRDMIDHHDQAVAIALYTLASDANGETKAVASDVLLSQRQEIGLMDGILGGWNRLRGDPDRTAMEWMGHPGPVSTMFGMQTAEKVAALRAADAPEVDRLFFTMMREHHEGGVHMAEYAEEHAQSKRVRDLATFMATIQRTEINEIDAAIKRLGLG
jgi:uncharacterized protein (DUF305 family)